MALNFTRDVKLILEDPAATNRWEIPILDGFSFSQTVNSSEITINEAGATSRRARLLFNDALAPVEWSFSTYVRPTVHNTQSRAVEEALWGMFCGAEQYSGGIFTGNSSPAAVNAISGTTSNVFNFNNSNISAFADGWSLYFMFEGSSDQVYKITNTVINSVSADFDIDGIATINWSGFGAALQDNGTTKVAATLSEGVLDTNNFIRNRISTVTLQRTDKFIGDPDAQSQTQTLVIGSGATFTDNSGSPADSITVTGDVTATYPVGMKVGGLGIASGTTITSSAFASPDTVLELSLEATATPTTVYFHPANTLADDYSIVLTGGSINFENNISYLTPEELGTVNQPLGNITGARSISGNMTCYLDNDILQSKSGELFADLVSDTSTVRNVFAVGINIGGTVAPAVKFNLPTAHLEIPVINVEDLLTLDIAFHGQTSGGNVDSTDEATITYTTA
jgi:hypothetical protein